MRLIEFYKQVKSRTWPDIAAMFKARGQRGRLEPISNINVHRWATEEKREREKFGYAKSKVVVRGRKPNRRIERVTVLAEECSE